MYQVPTALLCFLVLQRYLLCSARLISKEYKLPRRFKKHFNRQRQIWPESKEILHLILRTRNTSIFPSCDMSQSRHGYLMTQEFCYMAVVITTCDFKKVHKCVIKESTGRLWRKLAPVRLAPISKSVPFEHPGRGTEQLKLAS